MVAFVQEIGLSLSAEEVFSKCVNSLPPSYENLVGNYMNATKFIAEKKHAESC